MVGEQDEVARSLTELLALAKVAMPDFLFAIDPRVHRALQLIAARSQVSSGRSPSILATPPMEMVDVDLPPTTQDVERMPGDQPPWDITAGLDAFMASGLAPESRTEATILIIRDWLVGHGYIQPTPEPEETH